MRIRLFSLSKTSLVSLMLLLGLGAGQSAVAQVNPNPTGSVPPKSTEITTNDSVVPLVYSVENSGATTGAVTFPLFANLPIIRPLPDPFVYLSTGARDTSFGNWEQHRNEILQAFQKYMVGTRPTCSDCTITASYTTTSANHYTMTVNITRTNAATGTKTTTLTSAIITPTGTAPAKGWPFIIGVDGAYGSLGSSYFPNIASVVFTSSQVTSSSSPTPTDGFYKLYSDTLCSFECSGAPTNLPPAPPGTPYNGNSGQFAAWSWGISRLLDGIQIISTTGTSPLPLDMTHSGITGCSYAGKIALYGGAMDERIALTISQENGGGGVPNWRYSYNGAAEYTLGTHDGTTEDIDTTDHHWWADTALQNQFSSVNVYKLPIDLHESAAMVAPRALLETGNATQYWLANEANYISARAIQQVYNTLGIGDRFGFIIDVGHGHCAIPSASTAPYFQPDVQSFINKFMLGQNVTTDVEVYPNGPGQPTALPSTQTAAPYDPSFPVYFPTMDYQRWYSWWGTNTPQFGNSWNTGGETDLWFNNPLTINTGDTVEAGYDIMMSAANHPAATIKVPNANLQTDVTCSDGSAYTLYIPLYTTYGTGQTFTIAGGDTNWYPSADPNSSLTYQGSVKVAGYSIMGATVNPGCANGQAGHASRTYFNTLGTASSSNGNPAGPGFVTTDTTQSPIVVRFHAADTSTGGGAWSAPVTINQLPLNYIK
jgi:hypothetical protein